MQTKNIMEYVFDEVIDESGDDGALKVTRGEDYYNKLAADIYGDETQGDESDVQVLVDYSTVKDLKNISKEGATGINQSDEVIEDVPDYMKPYQELATVALPELPEDTTDYAAEAIKIDPKYAGVNNKEDFEAIIHKKVERENYIKANARSYDELNRIVQDTKGEFDKNIINAIVDKKISEDPFYSENDRDSSLALLIDAETGELTAKGRSLVLREREAIRQYIGQIEATANQHAEKSYNQFKEYKVSVDKALAEFEFGGVKLDPEWIPHVKHTINSGQLDKMLSAANDLTQMDAAKKDVLLAVLLDPNISSRVLYKLHENSVDYGVNKKAKKILK